jgi:hypothetical protein
MPRSRSEGDEAAVAEVERAGPDHLADDDVDHLVDRRAWYVDRVAPTMPAAKRRSRSPSRSPARPARSMAR